MAALVQTTASNLAPQKQKSIQFLASLAGGVQHRRLRRFSVSQRSQKLKQPII
jgi:hypothetical protein